MTQDTQVLTPARVRIGYWINRGWDWFVEDIGMHVLITLIAAIFVSVGVFVVAGPVTAGLALVGLRKVERGRIDVKDFFDGFRFFLPALLSSLLIMVFTVVGLIFLIVPGLVIMAMYQLTFHFIVDRRQDFWEAMESSRKVVARDYFGFTLFGIVLGLLNMLGLLFFGVGILLTIPITALAVTAAYLDFSGSPPPALLPTEPVRID